MMKNSMATRTTTTTNTTTRTKRNGRLEDRFSVCHWTDDENNDTDRLVQVMEKYDSIYHENHNNYKMLSKGQLSIRSFYSSAKQRQRPKQKQKQGQQPYNFDVSKKRKLVQERREQQQRPSRSVGIPETPPSPEVFLSDDGNKIDNSNNPDGNDHRRSYIRQKVPPTPPSLSGRPLMIIETPPVSLPPLLQSAHACSTCDRSIDNNKNLNDTPSPKTKNPITDSSSTVVTLPNNRRGAIISIDNSKARKNEKDDQDSSKKGKKQLTQLFLDCGQTKNWGQVLCKKCGLLYVPGVPDDVKRHAIHCRKQQEQRERGIYWRPSHRTTDNIYHLKNISGTKRTTNKLRTNTKTVRGSNSQRNKEPSLSSSASSSLWPRLMDYVSKDMGLSTIYQQHQPRTNTSAFVYVPPGTSRVVGLVTVEPISYAYPVTSLRSLLPKHQSTTVSDIEKRTVPGADTKEQETSSDSIQCKRKAMLGVSLLWTHSSWRRQGIARRLLDAARQTAIFGLCVPKSQLAFSSPTQSGWALAQSYMTETGTTGSRTNNNVADPTATTTTTMGTGRKQTETPTTMTKSNPKEWNHPILPTSTSTILVYDYNNPMYLAETIAVSSVAIAKKNHDRW